jgi:O-antigen/teichoic acid export membrane protein
VSERASAAPSRLASEAVIYTAIDAAQNFLALLVVPASMFWLSPADMGVVTLAILGSQVVMAVAVLGLDFALVRFYYTWPAEARPAHIRGIFRIVSAWSLFLTVVAAGVLAGASVNGAGIWFVTIAAGTGLAVRQIPLSVFRVTSELWHYAVLAIGGSLLQAAFQIVALTSGLGVAGFLGGASAAAWAAALAGVYALVRFHDAHANGDVVAPDAGTQRFAAWSLLSAMSTRALAGVDRLAVYAWASMDTLGVYGTAARWALPLRMLSGGTRAALAPALSRGEVTAIGMVVSPLVVLLALLAAAIQLSSWALHLTPWHAVLGEFQRVLAILVVAQLLSSLCLIGQTFLYYFDRASHSSALSVSTVILTVLGLVILVPRYGAVGAAIVQFAANMAVFIVLLFMKGGAWMSRRAFMALAWLSFVCLSAWIEVPSIAAALAVTATLPLLFGSWRDLQTGMWSLTRTVGA